MSFPCRAADHQCACMHEARPSTPNPGEDLFDARAHAGKEILVNHEKWLNGPHTVNILNDQIPVLESFRQRVFDQFVIAMIFSLVGEGRLPMRQGGNLVPRSYSQRRAGMRSRGAVISLWHDASAARRCGQAKARSNAMSL